MMIETQRLFLREMTPEDFDALYKVLADSDVHKTHEESLSMFVWASAEAFFVYSLKCS